MGQGACRWYGCSDHGQRNSFPMLEECGSCRKIVALVAVTKGDDRLSTRVASLARASLRGSCCVPMLLCKAQKRLSNGRHHGSKFEPEDQDCSKRWQVDALWRPYQTTSPPMSLICLGSLLRKQRHLRPPVPADPSLFLPCRRRCMFHAGATIPCLGNGPCSAWLSGMISTPDARSGTESMMCGSVMHSPAQRRRAGSFVGGSAAGRRLRSGAYDGSSGCCQA